jgi:hypothetical protein
MGQAFRTKLCDSYSRFIIKIAYIIFLEKSQEIKIFFFCFFLVVAQIGMADNPDNHALHKNRGALKISFDLD